jgi:hypothetical protein
MHFGVENVGAVVIGQLGRRWALHHDPGFLAELSFGEQELQVELQSLLLSSCSVPEAETLTY